MTKDCSTCKKYVYEIGLEDNDEYCADGIDLNTVPENDACFECANYEADDVQHNNKIKYSLENKKSVEELFDRSKTHANFGTIGHVGHGQSALTDILKRAFYKRGECAACEGHFQIGEQTYRALDNRLYCEACYKEKYDAFN